MSKNVKILDISNVKNNTITQFMWYMYFGNFSQPNLQSNIFLKLRI